ncbi:hypothetical protein [Paenibacillus eucommiae]|uniref:DUF3221 domain-containing protein n=1 Tax=Paenibacillus eucommiae TaxID=1355755 RepID=A0ABS4IVC2_9BACL|nr:hypothetical protein [Paenibacillus eucommiae]MBP1990509.1 hypothetical protein [Paenibacillus eucommiae]
MKLRIIFIFLTSILLICTAAACSQNKDESAPYSSTTAFVRVIDKTEYNGQHAIIIELKKDSENTSRQTIYVLSVQQWSDIEINTNYTVHYRTTDKSVLVSIYPEGYSGTID